MNLRATMPVLSVMNFHRVLLGVTSRTAEAFFQASLD